MISIRALAVGSVLGALFAGAAIYVGYKTGIVDAGNIPAAILAFGALSMALGRRPSAHEGNIAQTVSSSAAIMAITGGWIGPIAALWLAGAEISFGSMIVWGIAVGVVGSLLAVPLRVAFITHGRLRFPSGAATAEVLSTMYDDARAGAGHLWRLAISGVAAFAFTFARAFFGWVPELSPFPSVGGIPAGAIMLGVFWSPLLGAIGYLAGARTAVSLLAGGAIAWLVIAPRLVADGIAAPDYPSLLGWLLWSGTALMIGGTVGGVAGTWRAMRASLRDVKKADGFRTTRAHGIALAIASAFVIAFGALAFDVTPLIPAFALVLSALLCAAAARAMGETDNTPAGPLGGFTQLVVGAVTPGGINTPLSGGAVVNGTLMHSAMMLQNWKTGAIVKSPPQSQLVAQGVGVVVGAFACGAAFLLIETAYGLGTERMPALAAVSWKATAEVVQHGVSAMPTHAPYAALLALVLGVVLSIGPIAKRAPSPVALGMGFILPPATSVTIAIGGFVYWLVARSSKQKADDGVAIASGLVGGEAGAGLVIAALIILEVNA